MLKLVHDPPGKSAVHSYRSRPLGYATTYEPLKVDDPNL